MPDLSAGRPSTPEEQFTDADVQLMWAARIRHVFAAPIAGPVCVCGFTPQTMVDWEKHHIRAGLEALAAAGRLLPASSEHHEERWRVVLCDPDGTPYAGGCHFDSRDEAARWTEEVMCPDPGDIRKIERRALGPWTEVDRSPTDA